MKLGTTISSIAHVTLLSWGMLSLQGPTKFEIIEESIQGEVIPFDEFNRIVNGVKDAEIADTPAPEKIEKPEIEEPAENAGETQLDEKTQLEDNIQPNLVEANAEPVKPEPEPIVEPEPEPVIEPEIEPIVEPVVEPEPEPDPEPALEEIASVEAPEAPKPPEPEVLREDPVVEPKIEPVEEPEKPALKLPEIAPKPIARPERKKPKDEIANLLSTEKATDAGKKRSKKKETLGKRTAKKFEKLSKGELDGLREAVAKCSTGNLGREISDDLIVVARFRLGKDGGLNGKVKTNATGGDAAERRKYSGDVGRYIRRCAPFDLPADKFEDWREMELTFRINEMFGF